MFNLVQHSNKAFKFKQRLDFKRYTFFTLPWVQHSNNAFKFQQRLDFKRFTFFWDTLYIPQNTRVHYLTYTYIGSTPTFLYIDLDLNSSLAAQARPVSFCCCTRIVHIPASRAFSSQQQLSLSLAIVDECMVAKIG